jgi:hypothetical protein
MLFRWLRERKERKLAEKQLSEARNELYNKLIDFSKKYAIPVGDMKEYSLCDESTEQTLRRHIAKNTYMLDGDLQGCKDILHTDFFNWGTLYGFGYNTYGCLGEGQEKNKNIENYYMTKKEDFERVYTNWLNYYTEE